MRLSLRPGKDKRDFDRLAKRQVDHVEAETSTGKRVVFTHTDRGNPPDLTDLAEGADYVVTCYPEEHKGKGYASKLCPAGGKGKTFIKYVAGGNVIVTSEDSEDGEE